MGEEERGGQPGAESGCGGEGFSIMLSEKRMYSFMEDGDFSSSRDLEHFSTIAAGLEKKISGSEGFSLLALSMAESRISRDFSVLQIAHLLARHGKSVLIVDCDFMSPGLSGLVPDMESHGFLDLLLYGSSLKSVTLETGIENVSVTGPGSFPVSRTIPFALKEFGKVRDFLAKSRDVVIYCTTLYTDEGLVNPIVSLVDGLILCCRIDEMQEGELERSLGGLGNDIPVKDLICFCNESEIGKEAVPPAATKDGGDQGEEDDAILELDPESEIPGPGSDEEEEAQPAVIEKSDEIDSIRSGRKSGVNLFRVIGISVIVVVASFLIWWYLTERSIKQREGADKMTELVARQQDARDNAARTSVVDSTKSDEDIQSVEGPVSGTDEEATDAAPPAGQDVPPATDPEVDADTGGADEVEPTETVREQTYAPDGQYYSVHIASFKEMSRAGTEADYFESRGYDVRVLEVSVGGEPWFRVYIGECETEEEAEDIRRQLLDIRRIAYTRVVKLSYEARDGS